MPADWSLLKKKLEDNEFAITYDYKDFESSCDIDYSSITVSVHLASTSIKEQKIITIEDLCTDSLKLEDVILDFRSSINTQSL